MTATRFPTLRSRSARHIICGICDPNPALSQPRGRLAEIPSKIARADHGRNAVEESRKRHTKRGHDKAEGENQKRLDEFIDHVWEEKHARRLWKRLKRHQDELPTFIDHKEVPSDNNGGEKVIRPAVLIHKNIFANGTEVGAQAHAIFMAILRTLKMRDYNPLQVLVDALKSYVRSAQLLPLPQKMTA